MTISVVIPCFNEETYIENCLISLQRQITQPFEIIVVDNNCTDETIKIALKYQVKVIKESQQGMIAARNTGFDAVKGDIIARCDADTILPENWITKINDHFSTDSKISALTGPITYYDGIIKSPILSTTYLNITKYIQKNHETISGPNMIIKKTTWDRVKQYTCLNDHLVHEDMDLAIHLFQHGFIVKRDNSLIVRTSARRIQKNFLSFFIEYPKRVYKMFKSHNII
ncbi:MAG: glycosyltransferase family 2 protein [bacterium]|nr:glycosyltransferase family 2 protein [bacterium]